MHAAEQLGENFELARYLHARSVSRDLVAEIGHQLVSGMTEPEAHVLAQDVFRARGITKLWHPTKIRFEKNTLCTFREESDPTVKLALGDLYFIDIGPVVEGHEGDYGETFVCGPGSDPLISAGRDLFRFTEECWRRDGLTGPELYDLASGRARELGFELDRRSAGHRCGDFPHALFHKGKLQDFPATPSPGLWVLEIHVVDPGRECAAFYEDILGAENLSASLDGPARALCAFDRDTGPRG